MLTYITKNMIKISKDNLFQWARVMPIFHCSALIFQIIFMIAWNNLLIYVICGLFILFYHLTSKVWVLFKLKDVYIDTQSGQIQFVDLKDNKVLINKADLIETTTKQQITKVKCKDYKDPFFCLIASRENLVYLQPNVENKS